MTPEEIRAAVFLIEMRAQLQKELLALAPHVHRQGRGLSSFHAESAEAAYERGYSIVKTKDTTALITRLREFERRLQPGVDSVGKPETLGLVMDLLEYFDQPDAAPTKSDL